MTLTGPQNLLNLTGKEATKSFKVYAKQFIVNLQRQNFFDMKVNHIEQYLSTNYGLKKNIYRPLLESLHYIQIMIDDNNNYKIVILKEPLKSVDMTCDQFIRFIIYGNEEIKGSDLWNNLLRYVFIHF